jgi:hypothetical protein
MPRKAKTIRVLIEMPSNWWDFEHPMGLATWTVRQMVEQKIEDALVEQYLSQVKLPKLDISKEEIRSRMIDKLAEKALDKGGENR